MIIGAVFALNAKDLLSALISCGIVGYGLVICFLLLKAPDLAIVQIVVETITLIIMVAVVLGSTRYELNETGKSKTNGISLTVTKRLIKLSSVIAFSLLTLYFFIVITEDLPAFGEHTLRMSKAYIQSAVDKTGSTNLVTGILFDFRGYDTLGEATILFTAVIGVLTVLRLKGKKTANERND